MNFWLCRNNERPYGGGYTFTNYCPYREHSDQKMNGIWFWYPHWLGGTELNVPLHRMDGVRTLAIESLGGEIPFGSVKNLNTGKVFNYEDLLPMEMYDKKAYYPWGLGDPIADLPKSPKFVFKDNLNLLGTDCRMSITQDQYKLLSLIEDGVDVNHSADEAIYSLVENNICYLATSNLVDTDFGCKLTELGKTVMTWVRLGNRM